MHIQGLNRCHKGIENLIKIANFYLILSQPIFLTLQDERGYHFTETVLQILQYHLWEIWALYLSPHMQVKQTTQIVQLYYKGIEKVVNYLISIGIAYEERRRFRRLISGIMFHINFRMLYTVTHLFSFSKLYNLFSFCTNEW